MTHNPDVISNETVPELRGRGGEGHRRTGSDGWVFSRDVMLVHEDSS